MGKVPSRPANRLLNFAVALIAAIGGLYSVTSASAQPALPSMAVPADGEMAVKALQLEYDTSGEIVTLTGDVQIYYGGRTIQADKVIYDRSKRRVKASGNVQMRSADGNVTYADDLDVTEDFADGFINSLRMVTPDKTRFAADRAERIGGNFTVLDKGVYTACEPCKDNLQKPPLWQVKAAKVTHDDQSKMIYFEDAYFEFMGVSLAWVPYFSAPDGSVKRKSGFLSPSFFNSSEIGFGMETPYFFALAPNYDLTLSPAYASRQGPILKGEWRHRLINGSYNIKAVGVFQQDPDVFPTAPNGPGPRDFRGSIESAGEFWLNERWSWGWDVKGFTDRYFVSDYDISSISGDEAVSQLYLRGSGTKSSFDLTGYHFYGLVSADSSQQLPLVHPSLDYDYVVDHPVFGGEAGWNINFTSLSREKADFQSLSGALCDGQSTATTNSTDCLQRGIDGNYTRLSGNLYWKRTFTDSAGQRWTPFAYLRGDVAWTSLDDSNTPAQLTSSDNDVSARILPAIGLEYRYPLIATTGLGTTVFEPIAQLIVRPRVAQVGSFANEDSQSLLFDDTNLFAWDKSSGYDRLEDGTRLNYGFQASLVTDTGGYYNALFGQSLVLDGNNSYTDPDMANTGSDSGLETDASDFVARFYAQPMPGIAVTTGARFDERDFAVKRLEVRAAGSLGRLSGDITYGYYAAQPDLGLLEREGIRQNTALKLTNTWSASTKLLYDIDNSELSYIGGGIKYADECTTVSLDFTRDYSDSSNKNAVDKIMLQVQFRTLGGTTLTRNVSAEQ